MRLPFPGPEPPFTPSTQRQRRLGEEIGRLFKVEGMEEVVDDQIRGNEKELEKYDEEGNSAE